MSISDNFPEVDFIDGDTLESTFLEMINDFQDKYEEITGKRKELALADPYRLIIQSCAIQLYQTKLYVDHAGKMNFIKYAYGDYLDVLGANKGVVRSRGKKASVTMRFALDFPLNFAVTVPEGTRVTARDDIYFSTLETAEIAIGNTYVDVVANCTEIGENANGYEIGVITTLVDPIAYVATVTNITVSSGGEEVETDDSLVERIYLSPAGYAAGTEDAFISDTKKCNTNITDVKVIGNNGVVNVMFITKNGIPTHEELEEVLSALNEKDRHVLTDNIVVSAPSSVNYSIDITYYINESDRTIASSIQKNVDEAIESFKEWQSSKIGRDINPSYLSKLIMDAGAKRVVINKPVYTPLSDIQIAELSSQNILYGGTEND